MTGARLGEDGGRSGIRLGESSGGEPWGNLELRSGYSYQPSLQFQLAGLGTDAPADGAARGAVGTFAQSMAERAAMLDPYGLRNVQGREMLPPVVVTGKRMPDPIESPATGEFLTSERINTRFAAVTPTGMTKLDGSCRVPDEWILGGRHAILVGREVLKGLLADLNFRGPTC